MDARVKPQARSGAYLFLEGLCEIGVDYLFCNLGTDHAPILEELANRRRIGAPIPRLIRCAHENTAAHVAGGYAIVTGRGQGVLVHVDVGTANAANAMHNMLRSRIPVLLMAGKAPFTMASERAGTRDTYVHFIQEPFDQASLVRPYVKWEWTLPSGLVARQALRRAHAVMQAEPKGPVYLTMHRETLTEELNEADSVGIQGEASVGGASRTVADPELISVLAEKIMGAKSPMILTAYGGRNPETSYAIEALAEFAGIAVYEAFPVNNIARGGPCFSGFSPERHVGTCDVGLLIDVDVPWIPSCTRLNPSTYWAHIDIDVLKTASPLWDFPASLRLQGNSARILEMLVEQVMTNSSRQFRMQAAERVSAIKSANQQRAAEAARLVATKGQHDAINPHYLFAELGRLLAPTDIVFDETVTNIGPLTMQIPRSLPGTMLRAAGAGLGASGGMALGAKLAAPERMMVQVVGDGSFYFNVPTSVFAASRQYDLPILTILLDNSGWGAVKEATLKVYPDGHVRNAGAYEAALCPDVEFTRIAEAFGIHAEKVVDPEDVTNALRRCVDIVRDGQGALVHVRVTPI